MGFADFGSEGSEVEDQNMEVPLHKGILKKKGPIRVTTLLSVQYNGDQNPVLATKAPALHAQARWLGDSAVGAWMVKRCGLCMDNITVSPKFGAIEESRRSKITSHQDSTP